jgi:hypothetical protein
MIRHIEFTIDFDLTCREDVEVFETYSDEEYLKNDIAEYINENTAKIMEHVIIKKVWYEED